MICPICRSTKPGSCNFSPRDDEHLRFPTNRSPNAQTWDRARNITTIILLFLLFLINVMMPQINLHEDAEGLAGLLQILRAGILNFSLYEFTLPPDYLVIWICWILWQRKWFIRAHQNANEEFSQRSHSDSDMLEYLRSCTREVCCINRYLIKESFIAYLANPRSFLGQQFSRKAKVFKYLFNSATLYVFLHFFWAFPKYSMGATPLSPGNIIFKLTLVAIGALVTWGVLPWTAIDGWTVRMGGYARELRKEVREMDLEEGEASARSLVVWWMKELFEEDGISEDNDSMKRVYFDPLGEDIVI